MFSNMDLDISPIGAKSTNWWSGSSLEAFESVFMAFGFGEPLASADLLAMIRHGRAIAGAVDGSCWGWR